MKNDAEQNATSRSSQALVGLFVAAALSATVAGCAPRSNAVPGQSYTTYTGTGSKPPSGSGSDVYCPDKDIDWECDDGSGGIERSSTAAYYHNGVGYFSRSSGVSNGARAVQPTQPTSGGTTTETKSASPAQTSPSTSTQTGSFTNSGSAATTTGGASAGTTGKSGTTAGTSGSGSSGISSSNSSGGGASIGGSSGSTGGTPSSHSGIGSSSSSGG